MRHLLLISFLMPMLTFGQVKMGDLITKRGLAYEMAGRTPYTGKAYILYPTGDTQTIATYKDGVLDGEITVWYDKGHKQADGFLDKGLRSGTWKLYYPSGKIKKQSNYAHDTENGEETFYFENGKIEKTGSYSEGKLSGKYTWYFENGQKKQEGFFTDGAQDSSWNEWYENGKQKWVGHFTNLEKDGDWTYWDEQGNVTVKKNYQHGLVIVAKDDLDTYIEKLQYYFARKNYKEALKNVEAAETLLTAKTDTTAEYMNLELYRSKCYSYAMHYRQGEKILLDAIGLTPAQAQTIQNAHLEKTGAKINQIITEINQKEQAGFRTVNHIALAVCYNILGDSVNLQQQQQIAMLKGGMKDYVINISLELYRLSGVRLDSYRNLQDVNDRIAKQGATERLEMEKVQYLIGLERFPEATKIVDKYLQKDAKNVTVLLSKAALETASGNYDKTKLYEEKALAIDPNALGGE